MMYDYLNPTTIATIVAELTRANYLQLGAVSEELAEAENALIAAVGRHEANSMIGDALAELD